MDRQILEDVFAFVAAIVAMGCFTGVLITWMKHRRSPQLPTSELMHRLDEISDRVNRIETSVDAVALEVERISEGQRFTTRLLADKTGAPIHVDRGAAASRDGLD